MYLDTDKEDKYLIYLILGITFEMNKTYAYKIQLKAICMPIVPSGFQFFS